MADHNTEPGNAGTPIWEQLAHDPELIAVEQRVGELSNLDSERFRLECELGDHYWNTGVPYITVTSRPTLGVGGDASRHSFHWDRPMEDYERRARDYFKPRKGQYLNDETQKFKDVTPIDEEIGIGVHDGKYYFVRNGRHIVSPDYDHIQPLGEGEFTVTVGQTSVVTKLLNEGERAILLEKRKRYEEIMEHFSENSSECLALQQGITYKVLERSGVPEYAIDKFQYANAADLTFTYAGSTVSIKVGGTMLHVETWDPSLDEFERSEVSRNFHSNIKIEGVQHSILKRAVDEGVPNWLKPYERKITDDIENIDRERTEFNDGFVAYCHQYGYRNFVMDTPHLSWSLPMALELVKLPIDESYPYIGQFNSITNGRLNVPQPGVFEHKPYKAPNTTWRFDPSGSISEIS
jgi:hypothetical protein